MLFCIIIICTNRKKEHYESLHGIIFLCLGLCVACWHVYRAVDLGLVLSGFGPQLGNAAGAELVWARPPRHLRPLPLPRPRGRRPQTSAQRCTRSFCPWIVLSFLSSLPRFVVTTLRLLLQTPAGFLTHFITVSFCKRPCELALEFQLPPHLGTAVLKPNLETNVKILNRSNREIEM